VHSECGAPNSFTQELIIVNTGAYFLYDFIAMAYYGLLDSSMTIHHVVCVLGIYISLMEGFSANDVIAGLFIAEISNPPMHGRVMLKHVGKRMTKLYELCEYLYIVLYIFGRCLIGSPVIYKVVSCTSSNFLVRAVAGVLALQSYYFVFKMIRLLRHRFRSYALRKSHGIKLHWFTVNEEGVARLKKIEQEEREKREAKAKNE